MTGVVLRATVTNFVEAVAFYEELTGEQAHEFEFEGLRIAKIGAFLIVSGSDEALRTHDHAATIQVADLDAALDTVTRHGGQILASAHSGPNGRRAIAAHPEGTIYEYIERRITPPQN